MKEVFDFTAYTGCFTLVPFSFAKHSSIGCGGESPVAFYPSTIEELCALVVKLKEEGIVFRVVGNLTNTLPPDERTDFVIICTKRLKGISLGEQVFVEAGVTSGVLLQACKTQGYSGAEFLTGIPCTLGGAAYMNAGADGRYIADILESVLVLRNGELCTLFPADCGYAYKQSVFMQNDDIILGASLRLQKASDEEISSRVRYYADRRAHLPAGKSMGCIFKNPDGKSAGQLIEGSGLKGMRIGGARVSTQHANFILNDGNATTKDICALITLIKNAVWAQYGVRLQEEIRYL